MHSVKEKVSKILRRFSGSQIQHILMDVSKDFCTIKIDTSQSQVAKLCVESLGIKCAVSTLQEKEKSILVVDLS
ncbi:MAG: hypothetical protein BWY19_00769 [bacterium ADurb.Bin212]|nr:MAG: hypothetical protein BWY19_00769 [bacterium ADurb.Bin212]